jgi:hypothetical protein
LVILCVKIKVQMIEHFNKLIEKGIVFNAFYIYLCA